MYHINKEITGSGENIALKNTAKHYYKKFDILGNSIQEGTPSIESEAPIESVGDNINLIDIASLIEGYVKDNGECSTSSQYGEMRSVFLKVEPNTQYTFKIHETAGKEVTWIGIGEYASDNGSSFILRNVYSPNKYIENASCTITTSNTTQYVIVSARNLIGATKIKFEKGQPTPYSPYGQGSIGIVECNQNLIDMNNTDWRINTNATYEQIGNNELKVNAKAGSYSGIYTKDIKVQDFRQPIVLSFYMKADKDCKVMAGTSGNERKTFDITTNYQRFSITDVGKETTGAIVFYGYNLSEDLAFYIKDIMIAYEESDYIEHRSQTKVLYTQQPFRAIGDVKDRFVKQNGVWYERHYGDRYIMTGNEQIQLMTSSDDGYPRFGISLPLAPETFDYSKVTIMSNMFKGVGHNNNQRSVKGALDLISNTNTTEQRATTRLSDKSINTVELFKAKLTELYNAGKSLYVDYVLKTPILIPCTPEQVEVLEYFEKEAYSYDEVTHIYSTDEVSPYFEVTAYERISEEFKTRLKEGKITRGYLKVLATDTLPEIIINENNYLKDLKIEELRYVPEEGIIGGTVAKRVSGNFNNVDSSFDIQDREIEVYLGVELEDETTEYIKYGTYIVQRPEDDQVNDNTSFEALDYMIKFNQEYKDRITYPCTLKQLLDDIIDQAGVNSKVATFANSDFIVENNQFEQGSTLRDVLKAITQIAFNWSRIDADDNLVMDFEIREETDEELGTDDYFSFKKSDDYGPVNVVVLRNSQVEGENVTVKDEELINSPKGYNLLNMKNAKGGNYAGITCTVNEDGTYNYVGTAGSTEAINVWLLGGYQVTTPSIVTLEPRKILYARL